MIELLNYKGLIMFKNICWHDYRKDTTDRWLVDQYQKWLHRNSLSTVNFVVFTEKECTLTEKNIKVGDATVDVQITIYPSKVYDIFIKHHYIWKDDWYVKCCIKCGKVKTHYTTKYVQQFFQNEFEKMKKTAINNKLVKIILKKHMEE